MSKLFFMFSRFFFLLVAFLGLGENLHYFEYSIFCTSAWGAPKKVDVDRFRVSQSDRFIPERTFNPDELSLRSLRMSGFFDSAPPEDVENFLFKESLTQQMLGVSLEEGRRGGILFHTKVSPSAFSHLRDVARVLDQRKYDVESGVERKLDAPGFINNFYFRTFASRGDKFVVVLERLDDATGRVAYDLYGMFLENGASKVRVLGSSSDPVTHLQWLNQDDLFIGFQSAGFTILEVTRFSSHLGVRASFDAGVYALQQGVPELGMVVGASYLGSPRKLLVGFSQGKVLNFTAGKEGPKVAVSELAHEMISLELSPNQAHLAVGSRDHGVSIYEWPKLKLTHHVPVKEGCAVKALAWHPNSLWLAVGTGRTDHRLMVYSLSAKRNFFEQDVKAQVTDLAWSESGTELVSTLGFPSDERGEALDATLLLWAVVEDGVGVDLKRLLGFPALNGRVLSVVLDTSESLGRLFTRVRVLASDGDGTVVTFKYSRAQPKQEKHPIRSSASLGGAFGFFGGVR